MSHVVLKVSKENSPFALGMTIGPMFLNLRIIPYGLRESVCKVPVSGILILD